MNSTFYSDAAYKTISTGAIPWEEIFEIFEKDVEKHHERSSYEEDLGSSSNDLINIKRTELHKIATRPTMLL